MYMYIALLVLIVSTWALTPPPPANRNPAISSAPQGTENLNKSARQTGRQKALIIPIL